MATKVFTSGLSDIIGHSFNYAIVDKSIPETEERVVGSLSINQVDPFRRLDTQCIHRHVEQLTLEMLVRRSPRKLFALCEKRNAGSFSVLEKCGFKIVADFQEEGIGLLFLRWSGHEIENITES
jgi:hypothetical protein